MKNALIKALFAATVMIAATLTITTKGHCGEIYTFSGGPAGGTFQFMVSGIITYEPVKKIQEFTLIGKSSGGSVENLRKIDSDRYAMGVVYSGELYMGRNGMLQDDPTRYENVLAVSYFYGAPAQLIVRKESGIKSVSQLKTLKVGVGNVGSGAFANCERLFTHLDIWDKMERNAMGYNDAATAFSNNQLDAFWVFVGYPAGAVLMAAQTTDIDLVDLYSEAESTGFFKKYPFFTKVVIPAGTYKGVDRNVESYQDSTLWVANKHVPEDVVYTLLSKIYTEEGLAHMREVKITAAAMRIKNGIKGIVTPLHPGAIKFWKEKGLM
ncbi:MAG: TAXI family TRAP transporter solute-binding subunit [Pseudomonadota bacterium]